MARNRFANQFLAYLWGIETDQGGLDYAPSGKFLAYLWGIET